MSIKPRLRVPAGSSRPRAALATSSPYDAADVMTSEVAAWRPWRQHPDTEIGWARDTVTARARDLARNNGWTAGAVARETDSVIGAKFRPAAKPDWRALGISRQEADRVAGEMESAWRLWADDPRHFADATRTCNAAGLIGLAYRSQWLDGDALGVLHWREDRGMFRTCLRVVDPDLLCNPNGGSDTATMRGGVEIDADGGAVAYHFRRDHPHSVWGAASVWDRVDRAQAWGRPQVIHHFDRHRDGQTRGVSRLAPIVDALKMEDKAARVTLQQMVLSALLGLYLRSQLDPETVTDLLDNGAENYLNLDTARTTLAESKQLTFGGVRIPVLPPGDSIDTVSAGSPGPQYEAFQATVLRRIAAGVGTSYEQLAVDWSKTNYSSARAALIEIWRGWTANRDRFAAGFCQPLYLAVIEDAIDLGLVTLPAGAPGFWEAPGAWCRATWIGPGRGWVDPVKEVEGAVMRVAAGFSTMEHEAAELSGADYEETLAQIAAEIEALPPGVAHPAQTAFAELSGAANGAPRATAADGQGVVMSDPNAYGVAVRAGAVTPQRADEDHFRAGLGLPAAGAEVNAAWAEAGGVRAPITIKSGVAEDADPNAAD